MILGGIADAIKGQFEGRSASKIHGKIVLVKKNVLDFNDFNASIVDRLSEVIGHGVWLQLISATVPDPKRGNRGILSNEANVENWISTLSPLTPGDSTYTVTFDWDEKHGVPGAFIIRNNHQFEFLLKTVTLENVPVKGSVHFVCNSWVYNTSKYNYDRVFFANETYLPSKVPEPLKAYVEEELLNLRGQGVTGELKEWDRVYDYATYNDLGNPDADKKLARPVLGASAELPYPRRGKTGRGPTRTDPNSERRMLLSNIRLDIYVPRDERFGHLKMSDFLGYALKALVQSFVPALEAVFDTTPLEFDTFQDVLNLYEGGLKLPDIPALDALKDMIPFELLKELVRSDGERVLKFPLPLIIQVDKEAWRTDEEFGREMVAGVNPVIIRGLRQFPPVSTLDPSKYGDQTSTITARDIEINMGGVSVREALETNRLYILDHHDNLIPYLNRINSTSNKIYATRTIVFIKDDGTLKPLAIELSVPHPDGEKHGVVSKVFTPADQGVEGSMWQLAKAYAAVNDSGVHQLISHWLNTHAVIEPFVIATNRQLSVVHPIHKLLSPHYRDTMNINALARQTLICAGGLLEKTVFPGQYAMEMSAVIYKSWNFFEQALPQDLLKRGVAVEDSSQSNGVRLLIQDYPYAVDGLQIWSAIRTWVSDYVSIYYRDDAAIRSDTALQAWWAEVREVGHGDKKDEPWWPRMTCISDLISSCTTIIWVASALHAAVNFGQYPYAGYLPNRPTISRRFMPQPGTKEYADLEKNPEKEFLRTITSQLQTIVGVSLIEILSRHASDEVYLGQRASPEWTTDKAALDAFERFGKKLEEIEKEILAKNSNARLKNRNGPAKAPYTLLYPNTSDTSGTGGLTGKGIPNSISI